jgi:flagellin-like hook-associated protein FlgL
MSDVTLSKAVRANLLSLQNTAQMMDKTQSRLATGNKVNSALDNPSNFFTASALNSRAADMSNLLDSMASGIKVIEAADKGITAITKNIESMQSTLRQARQDKSFQTDTYEVGKDSTLKLSGGQFPEGFEVKLQEPTGGKAASVSFDVAYTDATAGASTDSTASGAGARTTIQYNAAAGFGDGDKLKIDGTEITLPNTTVSSAANLATSITSALNTAGISTTGPNAKYTVSSDAATGKVIIENTDKTKASPSVEFVSGVNAATYGETSFTYDAANVGAVKVGGRDIATGGGNFESFVKSLEENGKDGGYRVVADASTKKISLVSTTPAGAAPTVTGLRENGPATTVGATSTAQSFAVNWTTVAAGTERSQTFDVSGVNWAAGTAFGVTLTGAVTDLTTLVGALNADATFSGTWTAANVGGNLEIKANAVGTGSAVPAPGITGAVSIGSSAGSAAGDLSLFGSANLTSTNTGDLVGELNNDATFKATYTAALDGSGNLLITNKTTGATPTIASPGNSAVTAAGAAIPGSNGTPVAAVSDGISVTRTGGTAGAFTGQKAAAAHEFTVTYGDKSAAITVVGQDGSPYAKSNQLDLVNDQLKAAGILDVTASFDADNKLTFTASGPEAKTLAISGKDVSLFGTANVSTGSPAVSAYKSTNTVDRFVEEINRNTGTAGKVRASNDNGKLRIENLSTQALDVEFDKDGAGVGAPTQHEIKGNVIRDNLAKQFNDLRDQLDKFADDSSFNGINLLRGDKLTITFNESGSSSIQIQAKDKNGNERPITAANLDLSSLVGQDLDNDTDIDALLGKLSTALSELRSQASTFGSNLSSVENRQSFTKNMINTLETGAANLTLADTNAEAANLLALQTRQQLSSSALSMASQQDQAVLQLLR